MAGESFDQALSCWDADLSVFIGPSKERRQEGFQPAVTLLDLFMGEYFQNFSKRALLSHPIHLKAALIQPFENKESPLVESPHNFVALIEEKLKQSFTVYSRDALGNTHSLVFESKKGNLAISQKDAKNFKLIYTYDEVPPSEEDSVEFAFYIAALEGLEIFIGDSKGTLFQTGENLFINSTTMKARIRITTDLSQGQWVGHISKGNRSFQKSKEIYSAYDWKIGWRTLRRQSFATAKIEIEIY